MKRKRRFQTPEEVRKETEYYLTAGIRNPGFLGWPSKLASGGNGQKATSRWVKPLPSPDSRPEYGTALTA